MFVAGVIGTIEPPIASHDVRPAVAVEVASRHPCPPPGVLAQAPLRSDVAKFPGLILEEPDRSPFTGQDQLRKTIAIQVAPHRSTDQSDFVQHSSVGRLDPPLPSLLPVNT